MYVERTQVAAVFIVSPTYEGACADVASAAAACHRAGVPLVVDEAHGAHLAFLGPLEEAKGGEGGKDGERCSFPRGEENLGCEAETDSGGGEGGFVEIEPPQVPRKSAVPPGGSSSRASLVCGYVVWTRDDANRRM